MRWKTEYKVLGQLRKIKRFLFFPRVINYEGRWLEYAVIEQKRDYDEGFFHWEDNKWEDESNNEGAIARKALRGEG